MIKTNGGLTKYQVKELQDDVISLNKDVREILENHLPHLREQMTGVSTLVKVVGTINILGILAVLAIGQLIK